jgi:quercetin dioxygenase-like cupin family protein
MFGEDDRRLNEATDARTNEQAPTLPMAGRGDQALAELRRRWADLPMIPKLVLDRSEGIDNSWPGFDVRTVLVGEESAGRFTFHDVIIAPGAGLPAHHLGGSDTYWCVLDGEVELTVGARTETARRDAFAYAPQDTTQAVRNGAQAPARLFLWHSPAGPERAFAAAHQLWRTEPGSPPHAYQEVLGELGFSFHGPEDRLANDSRTNATSERLEVSVNTFDDYAGLRAEWARRTPIPKLLHDRGAVADIPMKGQDTKVLLSGDEGSGRAVVMHYGIEPGYIAPSHHQPSEEEVFLVLEGRLELTLGNVTTSVPRGGFGFVPRYATHGFCNLTAAETRTVTINSPAGHERGFEMIVREGSSEKLPDLLVAHGWHVHQAYQPAD